MIKKKLFNINISNILLMVLKPLYLKMSLQQRNLNKCKSRISRWLKQSFVITNIVKGTLETISSDNGKMIQKWRQKIKRVLTGMYFLVMFSHIFKRMSLKFLNKHFPCDGGFLLYPEIRHFFFFSFYAQCLVRVLSCHDRKMEENKTPNMDEIEIWISYYI